MAWQALEGVDCANPDRLRYWPARNAYLSRRRSRYRLQRFHSTKPHGVPIYSSSAGLHLNAAAYAAPQPGQWGTASRESITGPGQFSLDAAMARTFRPTTRFYLDARVEATNLLNHATFKGWITTVNSAQFGLPLAASPMRSLQTTLRLRF